MSEEMMLMHNRPSANWSIVASWRANCGNHISPIRTASSRLMCSVWVAIAAANAVESMPSVYPDGSSTLSKPLRSAVPTMSEQCSQLLASAGSGTPRNS
jgi:hypothetical protein